VGDRLPLDSRRDRALKPPSLLAITPGDGRDLKPWLIALAAAGLPGVLIREPALGADDLATLAALPIELVILHAKNPHAAALGMPLHGPGCAGRSCHDETDVDTALESGAHYALLSPIWRPTSKPGDRRSPLGLERFLRCAKGRPVLALGGVDVARYRALQAHGAGAAVCGALFGASSPSEAAQRLRAFLHDGS